MDAKCCQLSLMCEKFHCDSLRNDGALGNRKSDNSKNNNNKSNVPSAWRLVSGLKINVRAMFPIIVLTEKPRQ